LYQGIGTGIVTLGTYSVRLTKLDDVFLPMSNPSHFCVVLVYSNASRLVLFYGVFFFGDIARDNWVKRFMRDQLHYKVPTTQKTYTHLS
jgi:hypothetical protein